MSQWIAQLQHPDARQRKSAIAAIARAKDTASMAELEQVSRLDPDAQIREYAAQAIRYIQKQTKPLTEPDFLRNASFEDPPVRATRHQRQQEREQNWWITDLTFHTVVNVLGGLLVTILILPRFASAFQASPLSSLPSNSDTLLKLMTRLLSAHLDELIVAGVLLGILSVGASFLTFRMIHQVAVHVFNGANTFEGMLHETLIPHAIASALIYVIFFVASWTNPLVIFQTGGSSLSMLVLGIVGLVYIAGYIALGYILGKTYTFSTEKGCLTIGIALFMCGFGGFLMGALFSSH